LAILLTFPAFSAVANQVVAWGDPTNVPVEANQAVAISAGWGYSLAIAPDGSLIDWGNDPGTPPTGLNNLEAVAASHGHSLALTADGTVIVWGSPDLSWAWGGTPDGLTNVVAISANGDVDGEQSLALKNDGTVVAWGDDTYGQTDLPDDLTNVIAIAAGDFHSLALKSDGTVSARGWDGEGELDMPDGLTNVVAISAGAGHSIATTIPLQFTSIIVTNQDSLLRFHTFYGQQYSVEFSPELSPVSWTPLSAGSFSGNGYDITVIDTNAVVSSPARFYRLKQ
jgi:hypothetical protein